MQMVMQTQMQMQMRMAPLFVWGGISERAANSVCSLPRLRGRGGEGVSVRI
jgi:hypothetical protein